MVYALYGFIFGLFIPYIARRFAKFMPATFAYALWQIVRPGKSSKKKKTPAYKALRKSFLWRSLMCGLVAGALSYGAAVNFGTIGIGWILAYIWILLLLAEIDYRMFLLPDILTIPLLLSGVLVSAMGWGFVSPQESALGAFIGYFLPVIVSLLFVWKNKDAFGGGDIKLLSAIGAWLGPDNLLYVIIVSCVLFIAYALAKRQRCGAYGPALALAGIIVAFYFFGV